MHQLRSACFIICEKDKRIIQRCLEQRGMSKEEIKRLPADYFFKRCKLAIPCPSELAARVQTVWLQFEHAERADGRPFTNKEVKDVHEKILEHIARGCVSDPPGRSMYYDLGRSESGMPNWNGTRGTSQLEGFHMHLVRAIRTWAISPELMDSLVLEFVIR